MPAVRESVAAPASSAAQPAWGRGREGEGESSRGRGVRHEGGTGAEVESAGGGSGAAAHLHLGERVAPQRLVARQVLQQLRPGRSGADGGGKRHPSPRRPLATTGAASLTLKRPAVAREARHAPRTVSQCVPAVPPAPPRTWHRLRRPPTRRSPRWPRPAARLRAWRARRCTACSLAPTAGGGHVRKRPLAHMPRFGLTGPFHVGNWWRAPRGELHSPKSPAAAPSASSSACASAASGSRHAHTDRTPSVSK